MDCVCFWNLPGIVAEDCLKILWCQTTSTDTIYLCNQVYRLKIVEFWDGAFDPVWIMKRSSVFTIELLLNRRIGNRLISKNRIRCLNNPEIQIIVLHRVSVSVAPAMRELNHKVTQRYGWLHFMWTTKVWMFPKRPFRVRQGNHEFDDTFNASAHQCFWTQEAPPSKLVTPCQINENR